MIQARYTEMYKGFQLDIIIIVKHKKDLIRICGKSNYFINNWVNFSSSVNKDIEHYVKYVCFSILSGEFCFCKPDWRKKVLPHTLVINFIDEYRKVFPTYQHTQNYFKAQKKQVKLNKQYTEKDFFELVDKIGECQDGDIHIIDSTEDYPVEGEKKYRIYHKKGYCIDISKEARSEDENTGEVLEWDYVFLEVWDGFNSIGLQSAYGLISNDKTFKKYINSI